MLNIISLGAGVQSTVVILMAEHGEIAPTPDCAIFADTEGEPKLVYKHLEWLKSVCKIPIHIVSNGNLWKSATSVRRTKDGLRSYIKTPIPVKTKNDYDGTEGLHLRQCTTDFKIEPINRKIRDLLGLRRVSSKSPILATIMIGISLDEAIRKKPNKLPWVQNRWPLLEKNMTRNACYDWLEKNNYPVVRPRDATLKRPQWPPRSACTFCPFRDDNSWLALAPDEFSDAVKKEKELQKAYAETEFKSVPYFHSQRIPLSEVKLIHKSESNKMHQIDLFNNECEGMCGV